MSYKIFKIQYNLSLIFLLCLSVRTASPLAKLPSCPSNSFPALAHITQIESNIQP